MSPLIQSALVRAGRTFLQVFLGVYLIGFIGDAADDRTLKAVLSLALIEKAFVAGFIAVLSLLHRAVLDPSPVPSMQDPAPGPVGEYPHQH
jgi:hypothetical protein